MSAKAINDNNSDIFGESDDDLLDAFNANQVRFIYNILCFLLPNVKKGQKYFVSNKNIDKYCFT